MVRGLAAQRSSKVRDETPAGLTNRKKKMSEIWIGAEHSPCTVTTEKKRET